jgi:N-methylhydantoinase A
LTAKPQWLASSDVGGTFTDLVVWDGTRLHTHKRSTDPKDRQRVVLEGTRDLVERVGGSMSDLSRVIHGTTAATNAVLQRKGGRVAILTNKGFEDLIEIGRQNRPKLYDLSVVRTEPLSPRNMRWGVSGRLDKDGRELEPLDEEAIRDAADAMEASSVDAVAVCFLHSYANPSHEERAAVLLRDAGLPRVTTSNAVSPEPREFERYNTALVNAFLQPIFEDNLSRMEQGLRRLGATAPLFVVESGGGMVDAHEAQRQPVRTVLSGPAGGVAASVDLAKRLRIQEVLTLDMGGTSTDLAVLHDGRAVLRRETEMAGLPIRTPAIDITTIGAGGGSIATQDAGGILQVGPESAEAWPGPACYGRGGMRATVTDADVFLGRIAPSGFLGGQGEVRLDVAAAEKALSGLGARLGLDPRATAEAVVEVATANLHRGIRRTTTERGLDPATHALVTYGGAGPMHGVDAASGVGIRRIIVPAQPAVFSAWGMLVGDVRHGFSRALLLTASPAALKKAQAAFAQLEMDARRRFHEEGFAKADIAMEFLADLRYAGQSFELSVPLRTGSATSLSAGAKRFHAAHKERYGHADPKRPVEIVSIRIDASGRLRPRPQTAKIATGSVRPPNASRTGERDAFFLAHGSHRAPVIDRGGLLAGNRLTGPSIIEGGDHTFLLPPGAKARVLAWGEMEVVLRA